MISEMKRPQDAMKARRPYRKCSDQLTTRQAAWMLQGFATTFYVVFSVVMYVYIGSAVASPAFLSLPPKWAKAAFGIALGNFLLYAALSASLHSRPHSCSRSAGGLYSHTAAKLLIVRIFRHRGRRHLHTHTVLGWSVWIALCFVAVAIAFLVRACLAPALTPISADLFVPYRDRGRAIRQLVHVRTSGLFLAPRYLPLVRWDGRDPPAAIRHISRRRDDHPRLIHLRRRHLCLREGACARSIVRASS
jgi:hypothetical protein